MSNIYFVSDLHFYHKSIISFSQRPFSSVEEMNQKLIDNWNALVKPNDTIYSLGDFSFTNYLLTCSILKQLNGQHHMILGNHDKVIIQNESKLLATGLVKSIQNYKEIRYKDKFIVLFHYGQRVWNKSHYGSYMLYGHSHNSLPPYGRSFDVGVDSTVITKEYRPISFDEVQTYMENVPIKIVDHHNERTT